MSKNHKIQLLSIYFVLNNTQQKLKFDYNNDKSQHMDNDILLPQLLKVLNFAAQKHKNQTRKDGKIPYINHPIQVANILAQNGETDISLLSAALLHDTIEDTNTSEEEILENFGQEVLQIVLDCTDDKSLSKQERKDKQVSSASSKCRPAKALKIADKICNVKDISSSPPKGWSIKRKEEYLDWSAKVVNELSGTNTQLEEYFNEILSKSRAKLERQKEQELDTV